MCYVMHALKKKIFYGGSYVFIGYKLYRQSKKSHIRIADKCFKNMSVSCKPLKETHHSQNNSMSGSVPPSPAHNDIWNIISRAWHFCPIKTVNLRVNSSLIKCQKTVKLLSWCEDSHKRRLKIMILFFYFLGRLGWSDWLIWRQSRSLRGSSKLFYESVLLKNDLEIITIIFCLT